MVCLGSLIVDAVVPQHINRTPSPQILKYKRSKYVLSVLMYNVRAETLWYLSYGGAGKRFLFHLKFFSDFMLSLYCVLILAICIYVCFAGKVLFQFPAFGS